MNFFKHFKVLKVFAHTQFDAAQIVHVVLIAWLNGLGVFACWPRSSSSPILRPSVRRDHDARSVYYNDTHLAITAGFYFTTLYICKGLKIY